MEKVDYVNGNLNGNQKAGNRGLRVKWSLKQCEQCVCRDQIMVMEGSSKQEIIGKFYLESDV